MTTDTERMDYLETLRNRAVFVNKKNPAYFQSTDIHINGPDHCSIYARSLIGDIEYEGHGASVREAIDFAMFELSDRRLTMRNEKTSARIATLAGRILRGGKFTMKELRSVLASALTQVRDRVKRK